MRLLSLFFLSLATLDCSVNAFSPSFLFSSSKVFQQRPAGDHAVSPLFATIPPPKKKGYVPKWKKLDTLADKMGVDSTIAPDQVGLKGTIAVVFRQGNETKRTMALAGQPLKEVAIQAGQFIKYGCGKGECGTCECLVNGQWIRPCQAVVPANANANGADYVVQVKAVKAKVVSSGKFYSVRSFLLGFWNNLLGMVGFVKYRRAAKKNWDERREYEDLIKQKTLEKRRLRELAASQQQQSK
jgi:hypothetical protein